MRLVRLELHGFKSFARKTELQFDPGITAVIGPNGSGKSNIADAVRWVLGEQSAKALRGSKMEDVIFNGTQERKAQAFCEVALTFDNSDAALPVDFNEVTVTRRVYRSGDSEYAINRNNCRLKDINELFRDTGIGKEGYSIIGQGKVEEILSNKSGDRRAALEEAAGVMRYRVRKEEAVRKLENTRKNLERLEDILNELQSQREPLQEQAEKARVYLKLRDELKALEVNVFLHQYERMQERLVSAESAMQAMQEESELLYESERTLSGDTAAQEEALRAIEQAASVAQNALITLMSGMEAHIGEAGVLNERKEHLLKERERLLSSITENEHRWEDRLAQIERLKTSDTAGRDMLKELDDEIAAADAELKDLQQAVELKENTLNAQKNSIIESLNRLSDAKSQLSRMEAMTSALNQRLGAVAADQESNAQEREGLEQELQDAQGEWDAQQQKKRAFLNEKDRLNDELKQAQEENRLSQARLHELEQNCNAMRSRSNVLEEMARAHEGYYASVRNVLKDCERDVALRRSVLGVVAELISVPQKYETALEMALGSSLQNIVTPTPEDAKRVIDHLRARQYGRATLLPVSAMRGRLLNAEERETLRMPGCIGIASELVGFEERYRSVVENLLGRTVIVENLDAGIAINKRANSAFRIATLQGDIINPGGSMTGGSVQKREFSLLGRERELKELERSIREAEAAIKSQGQKRAQAEEAVETLKLTLQQAEAALHAQDIESARHKEKLELIERDLKQNAQKAERMELECAQIRDNLADIEKEREGLSSVQTGIEAGSAATQEDVQRTQAELTRLRALQEELSAAMTERKVRRMALKKEEDAVLLETRRLEQELRDTQRMIEGNKAAHARTLEQETALTQQLQALNEVIAQEQAAVDLRKEEQHAMEEERLRRSQTLSDTRARKDELNTRLRELEEKRHKQELTKSRTEVELEAMVQRIMADYELTYEEALPLRTEGIAITAAHVRIDELKKDIRALGTINVNAVEDYEILNERYTALNTQCEDLNRAEQDLNTLIGELTQTMEKQFLQQFTRIQQNFTAVFEQLFGGGYAELRLSDPKDVLNCDIDIIAQPPGKKLQLLTLLSGGERALTAIALLFAMLKLKPTVFCILDEIESSLDEVNVTRFANYLREYSDDTQFILITHRKGSMEVCNALYGVAMEEKGVSKIVSARFQEAG